MVLEKIGLRVVETCAIKLFDESFRLGMVVVHLLRQKREASLIFGHRKPLYDDIMDWLFSTLVLYSVFFFLVNSSLTCVVG